MRTDYTIGNACNIPLNQQMGTVPNMGDALRDWLQYITFGQITKVIQGFQVIEDVTEINFWGVIQPLSGRNLTLLPEGQRGWDWVQVYAQASPNGAVLDLALDDIITYIGKQYRVMARKDFNLYSYVYYELVTNYTGSVPTP